MNEMSAWLELIGGELFYRGLTIILPNSGNVNKIKKPNKFLDILTHSP
jgi:hypothetical protein